MVQRIRQQMAPIGSVRERIRGPAARKLTVLTGKFSPVRRDGSRRAQDCTSAILRRRKFWPELPDQQIRDTCSAWPRGCGQSFSVYFLISVSSFTLFNASFLPFIFNFSKAFSNKLSFVGCTLLTISFTTRWSSTGSALSVSFPS